MAKRSYKKPLEYVFVSVETSDDTVTNARAELGLKDDEVAEIHKIDGQIMVSTLVDAANNKVTASMMLSMDPDIDEDPSDSENHDDLEVFYEHQLDLQQEVGAAGTAALKTSESKVSDFRVPVLVGTDVGVVVGTEYSGAAVGCYFWTRLYFTRRKANVMELNQILLKRR